MPAWVRSPLFSIRSAAFVWPELIALFLRASLRCLAASLFLSRRSLLALLLLSRRALRSEVASFDEVASVKVAFDSSC